MSDHTRQMPESTKKLIDRVWVEYQRRRSLGHDLPACVMVHPATYREFAMTVSYNGPVNCSNDSLTLFGIPLVMERQMPPDQIGWREAPWPILFRPQRGGLDESMKEVKTIRSWDDLQRAVAPGILHSVRWYGRDDRIGWDTYLVMGQYIGVSLACAFGFTNGPLSPPGAATTENQPQERTDDSHSAVSSPSVEQSHQGPDLPRE